MFECNRCGLCCMNLARSILYSDLDRGDGVCRYYESSSKKCTIYEQRPLKCNVDKIYEIYAIDKMTREQYYQMNYVACEKLKKQEEKRCF